MQVNFLPKTDCSRNIEVAFTKEETNENSKVINYVSYNNIKSLVIATHIPILVSGSIKSMHAGVHCEDED